MNWQVTTPGTIVFEKEEPFCFLSEIYDIAADRELGR